jgi:hypothetical protein
VDAGRRKLEQCGRRNLRKERPKWSWRAGQCNLIIQRRYDKQCQASAEQRPIRRLIGCGSWASLLIFSRRLVAQVDSPNQIGNPVGAYRWNHTKSLFALVAIALCKLLAAVHPLSVVKKYPQSKSFHTRAKRKGKKIFFLVNSIHGSAFFFSALLFPSKTFE